MTRLWVLSDLHLEAVPYLDAFDPTRADFEVLIAAGDIYEGDSDTAMRIVARLAGGKPAVFVPGNHEFWGREIERERRIMRRTAERHGITLLDDDVVELAGLRFAGGTLWADGALAGDDATPDRPTGERIEVGKSRRPITGADEALRHKRTRQVIETAMRETGAPLVVVTHHAPHPLCLPAIHRYGWAAGNSASDLSDLTDCGRAALWVHGHIHNRVNLTRPGGTRIVCNPAGPDFCNPEFRQNWVLMV
jgi:Icc-related predicted phosphoesterase